ncbi:hypothetical protein GF402_10655 [Candidatus Fermentibacteria bacterium]|nr:hypothetical protein [Candidatus Fermentibacteria bacterium]
MSLPIFLLSDFGDSDTYVGQMKSVLVEATGGSSRMIDLTHRICSGEVEEAAFHVSRCLPHLPPRSVLLAVVDPGVGTDRRAICCRCGGRLMVGPDNGLFGWVSLDGAAELPSAEKSSSSTFHGRDLFAPSAARLAIEPEWFDRLREIPLTELVRLERSMPRRSEETVEASVAHVDGFGNVVLWLESEDVKGLRIRAVRLPNGGRKTVRRVETYGLETEDLLLLQGSQGLMELALSGDSAARTTELTRGDRLVLLLG